MTDTQLAEIYAAQVFADCMLGIILAVEQCDWWLARIMGPAK